MRSPLELLHVVRLAHDFVIVERKLLSRRQLPLARIAGEARQVIHAVLGSPHPVGRRDVSLTFGTLCPELSVKQITSE